MDYKETIEKWLEQASEDSLFGTIYLDIDRLIVHNDCFGHVHGDLTIQKISECMRYTLRLVDHQFLRVGGDEFIAVLRGSEASSIFELAEEIKSTIQQLSIPMVDSSYLAQHPDEADQKTVSVSIGAILMKCMNGTKGFGIGRWIFESAQESVNYAKLAGRNKVIKIDLR